MKFQKNPAEIVPPSEVPEISPGITEMPEVPEEEPDEMPEEEPYELPEEPDEVPEEQPDEIPEEMPGIISCF